MTRSNTLKSVWQQVHQRIVAKLEIGLKDAAEVLLVKSLELVPQDTEDLKNSGQVRAISPLHFTVGYGGYDIGDQPNRSTKWPPRKGRMTHNVALYAVKQHEMYSWHHDKGQPGYLSTPRGDQAVQQEMRNAIRLAMGSST